jgi:hypothetical protein
MDNKMPQQKQPYEKLKELINAMDSIIDVLAAVPAEH